jgi:DNA-binding Xre family transcriptional regulator
MIRVKEDVNILALLASCGFTSYELRKNKIFSESSIQRLRKGGLPNWKELDFICKTLNYDISEIVEFVDDRN